MDTDKLINEALRISKISFIGGTGLFVLYFFSNSFHIALVSIFIIAMLGVVNLVFLCRLGLRGLKEKNNRKRILLACGIMSLNIPIALLYTYSVFALFDVMVVRFNNGTDKVLTNISIEGCDERRIGDMQPGDSIIEWIPAMECFERAMTIRYQIGNEIKQETVHGYVIYGERINHEIGDNDITDGE
jgi:amino acid transporter